MRKRALIAVAAASLLLAPPAARAAPDWPGYLNGVAHTSYAPAAETITPANAASLAPAWTFKPPAHSDRPSPSLYASPTVSGGRVYIGTNDGWFYVLNARTGAVLASRDLGIEQACTLNATRKGVQATAAVAADPNRGTGAVTVYVTGGTPAGGSGGIYLYALDAVDLHPVWATDPVAVDTQPGALAWSSPTVTGRVFVGIASQCDNPLVRGGVKSFARSNGALKATYWSVPAGNVGASVWTSVASANGSLWATTGNSDEVTPGADPGDGYSLVRLATSNLAVQGRWTIPGAFTAAEDLDFGASPLPFTQTVDGSSVGMVGACDKDGFFYALRQDALAAGPEWSAQIGNPSTEPPNDSCLSAAAWDKGKRQLIVGGNSSPGVDGQARAGSLRALSPQTDAAQRVLWDVGLPCDVIGTPTVDGAGVVAAVGWTQCEVGATPSLYLFDGRHTVPNPAGRPDPQRLATFPLPAAAFAQPVFADDALFVAPTSGGLSAYRLPG